ncbi:MAG: ribosomal RNA small subunit methyltransferase I [Patescibacteria group bacterium]|nr:MAG: ribosomal RNA small subunit methyltransferase I [Patescibacteria group bacterium]
MLYITATPIGNLKDMSLSTAEVIANADIILAEDTRSYLKLKHAVSNLFGLTINHLQKVVAYYKDVEFAKLDLVLKYLLENKNVVLLSDAGLPLINDPGHLLLQKVKELNLPYTVIPGPSAFATAVVFSGFSYKEIVFLGYFPKKIKDAYYQKLKQVNSSCDSAVFVAYESPKRVVRTLNQLLDNLNILVCVCQEMTKLHQQILFIENSDQLDKITPKGEFTLVFKFLRD